MGVDSVYLRWSVGSGHPRLFGQWSDLFRDQSLESVPSCCHLDRIADEQKSNSEGPVVEDDSTAIE